jgi:predicted DNA-binding transcriptional regulator YafY
MRRADRLFEIIQTLRRKKATRAADLATHLGVSERTIYRDIGDMVARGVPIEGEAGVGYILRPGFDLPPLMFNENEVEALLLGARIVQSWADPELARAAAAAIDKVAAVSPDALRQQFDLVRLWAPADHAQQVITIDQAALRHAIRDQRKIEFTYQDLDGNTSERVAHPLIMAFYGPVWLLAAWCEVRDGFRVFRIDRMSGFTVLDTKFEAKRRQTARDFLKQDAARKAGLVVHISLFDRIRPILTSRVGQQPGDARCSLPASLIWTFGSAAGAIRHRTMGGSMVVTPPVRPSATAPRISAQPRMPRGAWCALPLR